jgi:hypothetical protein
MKANRPDLLTKLKNTFQLLTVGPQPQLELLPYLLPTVDIFAVQKNLHAIEIVSLWNTTGWKTCLQVPKGKKWTLLGYSLKPGTGSWTYSCLSVYDPVNNYDHYLEYSATNLTLPIMRQSVMVPLDESWIIRVYVASVTTAGNAYDSYLYYEEDKT